MDGHAGGAVRLWTERHGDVAGVAPAAHVQAVDAREREPGQDGDAIKTLVPGVGDVRVAEGAKVVQRQAVVGALGFLKAQHVRPRGREEAADLLDAQPDRVDVPGRDGKAHGGERIRNRRAGGRRA